MRRAPCDHTDRLPRTTADAVTEREARALAPSSMLFGSAPRELSRRVAAYGFAAAGVVVVVVALASFVVVGLVTSVAL
jgi:hypothetical protein